MVGSTYSVIRPFLLLARFCGLLPLYNIRINDFSQLRFKWISVLTCYWLILWMISMYVVAWSAYYTIVADIGAANTVSIIKLLVQLGPPLLITPVFLFVTARCGRSLKLWREVEETLPPLPPRIQYKLWLYAKIILSGQLVKHLLLDISEIETKHVCLKSTLLNAIHLQYVLKYPFLFHGACFPDLDKITLSLAYQLMMGLQWASGPLLIITVSKTLDYRLQSINTTLERHREQLMPTKYWQTMREQYNSISRLTRIANDLLHPVILVCCLTETVFIILFLYTVFNFHWKSHVYSALSVALVYHSYVILQLLYSMSAVSELSRRPLTVLTSVPTVVYNQEVSRFYDQVVFDHLALTGGKLFDVSRSFIVKVVSTLITYEVVLMQQNSLVVQISGTGLNTTTPNQDYCVGTVLPVYNALSRGKIQG